MESKSKISKEKTEKQNFNVALCTLLSKEAMFNAYKTNGYKGRFQALVKAEENFDYF